MAYLEDIKIVHRDLAARNVLGRYCTSELHDNIKLYFFATLLEFLVLFVPL